MSRAGFLQNRSVIDATVREWHDDVGWGIVVAPETPGGCWVHYSAIDVDGYRSLSGVTDVRLDYESAKQDGYRFRAVRVAVPGRASATPDEQPPSAAYRSSRIEWDD